MKYMGSKKTMLKNGLGEMLREQVPKSNRFFDPFCGSASVSWFVAENTNKQVIAGDLQRYSVDLANSILLRDKKIDNDNLDKLNTWFDLSQEFYDIVKIDIEKSKSKKYVAQNREISSQSNFNITSAYGGHYFSLEQSLKFDSLLAFLPQDEPLKSIVVSALIEAATQCVAAPGHTAQPFQPKNINGLKAIMEAWKRDPFLYTKKIIEGMSIRHSNNIGFAEVTEANTLLDKLEEGDLVFLDPPYSGVHYSRFYHVLETISMNCWMNVSGNGRYPAPKHRPKSDYSLKGKSKNALDTLFNKISSKKSNAIITFPTSNCSNGLSGDIVKSIAKKYFRVKKEVVKGRFSTLGGNNSNRPARQKSSELILLLEQK